MDYIPAHKDEEMRQQFFRTFTDDQLLKDIEISLAVAGRHRIDCLCCICKYYMAVCEEANARKLNLEIQ